MDTKALKQKILDLAIRGKLVPQDPNDEPASVLLEKIRAEKQQMVKDGMLKSKDLKNDTVIFVGEDNLHYEKFSDGTIKCLKKEISFKIPSTWTWVRLGFIGNWGAGATPNRAHSEYYGGDIPWLKTGDLNDDYITEIPETITELALKETSVKLNPVGSILIAMYGATIGKLGILTQQATTNQACCACCPVEGVYNKYLFYFLMSHKTKFINRGIGGAQPNISKEKIVATLMPLPPIDEQLRIVSSIESLFFNIERIVNEQLNISELVVKTKSKILDLAIRGKLVPQNPDDEPATVLLARIRREKEELIKAGKLKRDKRESVIFRGEDNSYYLRTGKLVEPLTDWSFDDLPKNWEICCFGEICNYGDCINTESSVIENSAWILDLEDIEKDTGRIVSRVSKADRPSISTKHKFHKGQVLYSKLRPYLNKVVLADRDGYCTSEILPLEFHAEIIPEYARYYLMSPTFLRYADKCSYGVKMPRLGTNDGKKAIFPLPPINEQRRIVKQIELMFSHLSGIEISVQ
jgi:type I restriction enzyme S subunit